VGVPQSLGWIVELRGRCLATERGVDGVGRPEGFPGSVRSIRQAKREEYGDVYNESDCWCIMAGGGGVTAVPSWIKS
jgi:hypothetical protein